MIFKNINLRQFRNVSSQKLNFNPGLNIFRGQNGQGKTNLIEALYLLTNGHSFRTNRWEDFSQKTIDSGFFIEAQINKGDFPFHVSLRFLKSKKSLRVNEKSVTGPFIKQNFPNLLFSPESLLIVKESAQKRRELIDDLCISLFPEYIQLLAESKRVQKQKKSLLKQIKEEKGHDEAKYKLLDQLSQILLEKSSYLALFRLQAIEEIGPLLLKEFLEIMDEHYGNVSINYLVSGQSVLGQKQREILNAMYKRWVELKDRELASGLVLVGAHKHDIQFNFNNQEARFFCSQGQQRAIILAFKMAQIRLHYRAHKEFPILLLDDVLSELDREKQMRFVNYLLSTEAQIFLTTTDAVEFPQKVQQSVFEVKDGSFFESDRLLTGGLSV